MVVVHGVGTFLDSIAGGQGRVGEVHLIGAVEQPLVEPHLIEKSSWPNGCVDHDGTGRFSRLVGSPLETEEVNVVWSNENAVLALAAGDDRTTSFKWIDRPQTRIDGRDEVI